MVRLGLFMLLCRVRAFVGTNAVLTPALNLKFVFGTNLSGWQGTRSG